MKTARYIGSAKNARWGGQTVQPGETITGSDELIDSLLKRADFEGASSDTTLIPAASEPADEQE